MTPTHPMLDSYYSQDLVFFSILVAVLASLYGADHDQPGEPEPGTGRRALARGGAFAMGLGIWSMHFIGMLAFNLPIALGYDLTLTGLSLVAAIGLGLCALAGESSPAPLAPDPVRGRADGAGIATMHYIGMAAMKIAPGIHTCLGSSSSPSSSPIRLGCRALDSVSPAQQLAPRLLQQGPRLPGDGAAIIGMHYTGMAAAQFPAESLCGAPTPVSIPSGWQPWSS